jgi:tRNA threonylcarbamoyladenosine biosynthesis protein TsaE
MHLADHHATERVGEQIGAVLAAGEVVALSGDLGAGKTCLARGILTGLGFGGDVPSPSFALVIPYDPPAVRLPVWHVDLYRLDRVDEVEELGLFEVLHDGALIIEWPERMGAMLPETALQLDLRMAPDGGRDLTARVPSGWTARWS